jgi:hypothetical protein
MTNESSFSEVSYNNFCPPQADWNISYFWVVGKVSKGVNVVKARLSLMDNGGLNPKLLFLVILSFLGAGAAIGATIAYYPQRPKYCARCHSMRPAYDRWARTVCTEVSCSGCHTGGRGTACLSLEIEDSNCTNTRCHPQERLFAEKKPYKKTLPFSHETHLKEDPPGLRLRCTACHSYQGGEKHFDIDERACNLCHFIPRNEVIRLADGSTDRHLRVVIASPPKADSPELTPKADSPLANNPSQGDCFASLAMTFPGTPSGVHLDGGEQELGRCALCHKDVEKKLQIYDKEFDHAAYERLVLDQRLDCMNCHHNEIVHGLGSVERGQCYYCHDKVPEDYSSAEEMHYDHTVRHKVACNPCHQPIAHKIYKGDKEVDACRSCKDLFSNWFAPDESVSTVSLPQRRMMKA